MGIAIEQHARVFLKGICEFITLPIHYFAGVRIRGRICGLKNQQAQYSVLLDTFGDISSVFTEGGAPSRAYQLGYLIVDNLGTGKSLESGGYSIPLIFKYIS
jgi:hypothetical protein